MNSDTCFLRYAHVRLIVVVVVEIPVCFLRDYLAFSFRGDATPEMKTLAIARRELSDIGIC